MMDGSGVHTTLSRVCAVPHAHRHKYTRRHAFSACLHVEDSEPAPEAGKSIVGWILGAAAGMVCPLMSALR